MIGEFEKRINKTMNYALEDPLTKKLVKIVDEARKEFFPTKPIWDKKYLENQLKNDRTLTQLEQSFIKQTILLMTWLGDKK